jgi:hypothetical protein
VRDAWDGSIQDIELEVTGFARQEFTQEQERAAVESAVSCMRKRSRLSCAEHRLQFRLAVHGACCAQSVLAGAVWCCTGFAAWTCHTEGGTALCWVSAAACCIVPTAALCC